ncbi:hypothetical protein BJF78_16455 [Pseudonocardia sp. CNS-139]|nr:hypothetical protein BJF78_16455 [Pseudonocardia sp. CNS-139]
MIVVTGATGKLGGLVVEDLLGRVPASEVAVVARALGKAAGYFDRGVDVRQGDYEDPGSLRIAFEGADVLLFVSSPDTTPGTRPRQHKNVVDAAVDAGVGRIVYTSAINAQNAPGFLADHTVTEKLLTASGVPHTFLRNTFYQETVLNPGLKAVVDAGVLRAADGGRPVNFASIADLALGASATLTGDGHAGAVYELRGPLWTFADLADVLTSVSGRPVSYEAGEGEQGSAFLHDLVASGFFAEPSGDLEKLIGRPPAGLRAGVEKALGA